jgi:hypothetical protein
MLKGVFYGVKFINPVAHYKQLYVSKTIYNPGVCPGIKFIFYF